MSSTRISKSGNVSTLETKLYVVPANYVADLLSIRFNNSKAYTLTVSKYSQATQSASVLYSLNLSAGDTVTDNFPYYLDSGDYLIATSSISGTHYTIVGTLNSK
jgi:hypothetical protein